MRARGRRRWPRVGQAGAAYEVAVGLNRFRAIAAVSASRSVSFCRRASGFSSVGCLVHAP